MEQVSFEDLQSLVSNSVRESRTLEFKSRLPDNSPKGRIKFLSEVTSLANTLGGDLVIGIEDEDGTAGSVPGVCVKSVDDAILRLEDIITSGTDPRIPGVSTHHVATDEDASVFVLRIPRSWVAPHAVTYNDHSRFYARHSAGKYMMDVREIRAAFSLTESLERRVRNFRAQRVDQIAHSDTPIRLHAGEPFLAVHLVPLGADDPAAAVELSGIKASLLSAKPLHPCAGLSARYNFDGVLVYDHAGSEGTTRSYVQVFRDGTIEAVSSRLLVGSGEFAKVLVPARYEGEVITGISRFLSLQQSLGVIPPVFVSVSMLGVKGCGMAPPQGYRDVGDTIDRDDLLVPEIVCEDLADDADVLLRPVLDRIWNAAGLARCESYNQDGRWEAPR